MAKVQIAIKLEGDGGFKVLNWTTIQKEFFCSFPNERELTIERQFYIIKGIVDDKKKREYKGWKNE